MSSDDTWENVRDAVLADPVARCAFKENELRRKLGADLDIEREKHGLTIREFAKRMQSSPSQVQRVLHKSLGGSLTMTTICRAADALDLDVTVHVRQKGDQPMTHAQIFRHGFDHGYAAAEYCEYDWAPPDAVERVETLVSEAHASEEHARQFSPFEFLAKELNDRDDREDAWDTFEQGVSSGIAAGAKDRLKGEADHDSN